MSAQTGERLQKVLARAGVGSRRACELLIDQGRVSVNGQIVDTQGMRVDPETDIINVDGERIPTRGDISVFIFNKPRGVVTTMSDEQGRPCVGDFLREASPGLFYVGRLDADTEGLLLITNDGLLGHRLGHPSFGITKTYLATVAGRLEAATIRTLLGGVDLDDGLAQCDAVRVREALAARTLVELTIHEGRNRIVRRMFEAVGHPVEQLARIAFGPLRLGNLRSGAMRELTTKELGNLYQAVGL